MCFFFINLIYVYLLPTYFNVKHLYLHFVYFIRFTEDLYPRYFMKWNLRLLVYRSVCLSVKRYPRGREVTLSEHFISCKAVPLIARSSPFSLFNLQVENESRLSEVEKEEEEVEEVVKEEEKEEFFICAIVPLLHNSSIII